MFILGVKEWNPIDGHFLQVTNYCDYLKDVASSSLSDEDFTQVVSYRFYMTYTAATCLLSLIAFFWLTFGRRNVKS